MCNLPTLSENFVSKLLNFSSGLGGTAGSSFWREARGSHGAAVRRAERGISKTFIPREIDRPSFLPPPLPGQPADVMAWENPPLMVVIEFKLEH